RPRGRRGPVVSSEGGSGHPAFHLDAGVEPRRSSGARRCQEAVRNPGTETMTGGEALVTSKIPRVSYPDTWSGLSGRVKMYVRMWAPSGDQTGWSWVTSAPFSAVI